MGSCIICGASVDGHVCASHEEDVYFEFRGDRPDQLTAGRFYHGTVDGFADFGVFVDIGDHVTGLLHTSELDRRLESLHWDPGDTVYVRVKAVHDNGNVDLGWSIRQGASEFRGGLIDTPDGDELPSGGGGTVERLTRRDTGEDREAADGGAAPTRAAEETSADEPEPTDESEGEPVSSGRETSEGARERASVASLNDRVGAPVRIEGWIVDVRQTSGPTVFEVRDETGVVECAAFESAGVRAFPELGAGDVVRLDGVVEEHMNDIQIETDSIVALDGEEREAVEQRLDDVLAERSQPEAVEPLADHPPVASTRAGITDAATAIRRAVFEGRTVVVRHPATVDGHAAGAALERAVVELLDDEHAEADAEYRYVHRRPLDGPVYGMGDAVRDVTRMLDARERHGETLPLFVFAGVGATADSRDALDLLGTYDAGRVVIAGIHPDDGIADAVETLAAPTDDADDVTATAICVEVAAAVCADVRDDLRHLPAVSYWRDPPAVYADLADEAGYDTEAVAQVREAVALEAFYLAYEDKRELIADLLFDGRDLAARASKRFRERLEAEVRTASSHLDRRSDDGRVVGVLDVAAFTHRYDFPPTELLLSALVDAEEIDAVVGVGEDRFHVRADRPVGVRAIAGAVADAVPDGGVEARGGGDGGISFLSGEREAVVDAAIEAVADALG